MNPMILVIFLVVFLFAYAIWKAVNCGEEEDVVDVCPDMSVSDVALGLTLGLFAIAIIIGCIILAAYGMGYF